MPPATLRDASSALVSLTDDEWGAVEAVLVERHLPAGEAFVREGEVARRTAFVAEGIVRYYTLRDGREHVTGFDAEGEVAGDFGSFFEGTPAVATVEAVEPCLLLVVTFADYERLAERHPALAAVRSRLAERLWAGERARAAEAHQLSAEARYRRLLDRSPHLLQRVPLYHVASYLGVTPEALSRIRRRL